MLAVIVSSVVSMIFGVLLIELDIATHPGPFVAFLLVPLFVDAGSVGAKVLILMAALPTAANAFVLAKQFEISVEQNTASVLLTTALSVITVSVVLVWLKIA